MSEKVIPWSRDEIDEEFAKAAAFARPAHFAYSQPESPAAFQGRALEGASFRGADLRRARFAFATLTDSCFHDALLAEADLAQARGLLPAQLAGADLTRCTLPPAWAAFPTVAEVQALAHRADRSVVGLVALCTALLLFAFATTDSQLLRDSGIANLFGLPLRPLLVLAVAPWLVLGQLALVQLHLRRLMSALVTLPAVFPDGTPLTQRLTSPLVELARLGFPRLRAAVPAPVGWGVVPLLAFVTGPLTLLLLWFRLLLIAFPWLATGSALALVLGAGATAALWRQARTTLIRPEKPKPLRGGVLRLACAVAVVLLLTLQRPLSRGLVLTDANLEGVSVRRTNLEGATFPGANLRDTNLAGSSLIGADLKGARNVEAANLDWVRFSLKTTTWPDGTQQPPLTWKQWGDSADTTGRYQVRPLPKGPANPSGDPDLRVLVRAR